MKGNNNNDLGEDIVDKRGSFKNRRRNCSENNAFK